MEEAAEPEFEVDDDPLGLEAGAPVGRKLLGRTIGKRTPPPPFSTGPFIPTCPFVALLLLVPCCCTDCCGPFVDVATLEVVFEAVELIFMTL